MKEARTNAIGAAVVALIAVSGYAAMLGLAGFRHGGGDPRVAFTIGDAQQLPSSVAALRLPTSHSPAGYDGQFYLMMATDPWLLDGSAITSIDAPRYRYRRIGVPALANTICLNSGARCESWAILCVLLGGVALGAACLSSGATHFGQSRWLGLLFMVFPAALLGATRALPDVLAASLVVAAWLAFLRQRTRALVAILCVAALVRETTLLVSFALAAHLWMRQQRRLAVGVAFIPAVLVASWVTYVAMRIGAAYSPGGPQFGWPLSGVVDMVAQVTGFAAPHTRNPGALINNGFTLVAVVLGATLCVRKWVADRSDWLALAGMLYAAVGVFATVAVWISFVGAARVLDVIPFACTAMAIRDRDRMAFLPLGIVAVPCIVDALLVSLRAG